jgi:hypothetical protein
MKWERFKCQYHHQGVYYHPKKLNESKKHWNMTELDSELRKNLKNAMGVTINETKRHGTIHRCNPKGIAYTILPKSSH